MRIVFYSHSSVLGNGAPESLLGIVSRLSIRHNCLVITPNEGSLNLELTKQNIQNKILPFQWSSNLDNVINASSFRKNLKLEPTLL